MKKVTIVSEDICITKQIINIINQNSKITINNMEEFTQKQNFSKKENIYFIDLTEYEYNMTEIIENLKFHEPNSIIIIITLKTKINYLLKSTLNIFACLTKSINFSNELTEIWNTITNNKKKRY